MYKRTDATKKDDIKHGKEQERLLAPHIKDFFAAGNGFIHNPDEFAKSDFFEDDSDGVHRTTWEVKTREDLSTNPKIRTEGVMINRDKFDHNSYCLFNFLDAVYYYQTNDAEWPHFPTREFAREREGGKCANNIVSYVPFHLLKFMHRHSQPRVARGMKGLRGVCLIKLED